jgi:hypothetical protein
MRSGPIELFFNVLQKAVGGNAVIAHDLTEIEWASLYEMANKQSLGGVVLDVFDSESKNRVFPSLQLLYQWIGEVEQIKLRNKLVNLRCEQLTSWFKKRNIDCCILKGQGVASLYSKPDLRQSGDVDVWVSEGRDLCVKTIRVEGIKVTNVDYVDCQAMFFTETKVEVHFRPTWMFNPFANKKVQRWILENKNAQMCNYDKGLGFNHPTISFNLVFSLLHIYRHLFSEGIGLRQLMDYYYILRHSTVEERKNAFNILNSFGVGKFVGAVMYVMRRVYGMESSILMCEPNEKQGTKLLEEIIRGGNFGQCDDRIKRIGAQQRWKRGWENFKRDMRFIKDYPSEVIWMPIWKVWHFFWRMSKGYLD